jgi:hypothetical protein
MLSGVVDQLKKLVSLLGDVKQLLIDIKGLLNKKT